MVVRRRYRARWTSFLYTAVALLLGLGAINSQNNLLFLVFGLAIAAIVVSGFYSGWMMMGLSVAREAPPVGAVGQPFTVRYLVKNRNRFVPAFALNIDETPEGRGVEKGRGPALPPLRAAIAHVGPGREALALATVTPLARGVVRLREFDVSSAFPFGIVRKAAIFREPEPVLIHPRTFRLRPGVASNLMTRGQTGAASVSRRGRGDEFFGLRAYSPGDSPRFIAWKPSARTGTLVVRETASTSAGCLWIFLNLNASAQDEAAIEGSISLAASLCVAGLEAGKDVGLAVPEHGVLCPPAPGARQRLAILNALTRLDPAAPHTEDASAARLVLRSIQRAATIVVHAGPVDPSAGPAGARHLATAELERIAMTGSEHEGEAAK